jgi:rhodanese-related sulfurtransferase
MERKYTIWSVFLVVLAMGLVILPKKSDRKEVEPKILLGSIAEKSRYLTVDQVTHRIIENDPTLLLIDLRPAEQSKIFALPGAVNIQVDSLLTKSTLELFSQPGKDKVFYASDDLDSEKAWLICTRYSMNRLYVMKGGLNEWISTFMKDQPASATASTADLDLLSFRNAARQYFTGEDRSVKAPVGSTASETIKITRKAPSAASGGGC